MYSSDKATDWLIEEQWFDFRQVLYQNVQNGFVTNPTPLPIQWVRSKDLSPVVKRPGREA